MCHFPMERFVNCKFCFIDAIIENAIIENDGNSIVFVVFLGRLDSLIPSPYAAGMEQKLLFSHCY